MQITLIGKDGESIQMDVGEIHYVLAGGIVRTAQKTYAVTEASAKEAQKALCCANLDGYPTGTIVGVWNDGVKLHKQDDGMFLDKHHEVSLTAEEVVLNYGVALFASKPSAFDLHAEEIEKAQALGFDSVEAMREHSEWLIKHGGPAFLSWVAKITSQARP